MIEVLLKILEERKPECLFKHDRKISRLNTRLDSLVGETEVIAVETDKAAKDLARFILEKHPIRREDSGMDINLNYRLMIFAPRQLEEIFSILIKTLSYYDLHLIKHT